MTVSKKDLFKAAAVALIGAWIVNTAIYFVAKNLGMIPDDVLLQPLNEPFSLFNVITDTTIGTVGGALTYAGLLKWNKQPVTRFRWLAFIVVLVAFAYPLIIPNLTFSMYIALNLMHIFGGIVVVAALTSLAVPDEEKRILSRQPASTDAPRTP